MGGFNDSLELSILGVSYIPRVIFGHLVGDSEWTYFPLISHILLSVPLLYISSIEKLPSLSDIQSAHDDSRGHLKGEPA